MTFSRIASIVVPLVFMGPLALSTTGCHTLNHTQRGALVGTGVGATAGAIIGHQSGQRDKGALIGAATGALAGSLIGNNEDMRDDRDAALAQVEYESRQSRAQALTNADLIKLAHGGVGDAVIINTIQDRGGNFDLSPDAILQLKSSGVSDPVILRIQELSRPSARQNIVLAPEPSVVFIAPPPIPPRRVIIPPCDYRPRYRRRW